MCHHPAGQNGLPHIETAAGTPGAQENTHKDFSTLSPCHIYYCPIGQNESYDQAQIQKVEKSHNVSLQGHKCREGRELTAIFTTDHINGL